jgi:hypothetical protein
MFSIIAIVAVGAFVSGQYMLARRSLVAPSDLQALCNGRSGIWKAIEMLNQGPRPDTLKTINTLDSLFNKQLFTKPSDSNSIPMETLIADSTPLILQPYACDSFGSCEVALSYNGCSELLSSKGIFHAIEKTVTVKLGGIIAFSPDTAYYLETGAPLQGAVWGKGHIGAMDSAGTIRQKDLQALIERLTDELTAKSDTMVQNLPLTIHRRLPLRPRLETKKTSHRFGRRTIDRQSRH